MNIKLATLTLHDGKTRVKVNPQRVAYLVSLDSQFTKIHFALEQTIDVVGSLESVATSLCSFEPAGNEFASS